MPAYPVLSVASIRLAAALSLSCIENNAAQVANPPGTASAAADVGDGRDDFASAWAGVASVTVTSSATLTAARAPCTPVPRRLAGTPRRMIHCLTLICYFPSIEDGGMAGRPGGSGNPRRGIFGSNHVRSQQSGMKSCERSQFGCWGSRPIQAVSQTVVDLRLKAQAAGT